MIPFEIQWKKHNPDRHEVFDGDVFLVAVEVKNNKTGKSHWEIEKLRVSCDWDGESGFFDLVYADCTESTSYDALAWEDFEYSIKVENYDYK